MNVLIINGSPRPNGNTTAAINEMKKIFDSQGIQTTEMRIGNKSIRGCIACNSCAEKGKCVFDDEVNKAAEL
ncbi:MAG: flavodoxin family protein, partial [Spirochaetales bacterium]|nr:flavodoxin family protein [Spirochaetales bacterium]